MMGWLARPLRPLRLRHLVYAYAIGIVSALVLVLVLGAIWRRRRSISA
jgi:hypothetical protein